MLRTLALPAVLAALLSTTALADPQQVSEISVEADLTTIDNEAAGRYWANLEADLTNALATRLTDQIGEDGARLIVRIEAVALTNSYALLTRGEEARLEGRVILSGDQRSEAYDLTVSVPEVDLVPPEGVSEENVTAPDVVTLAGDEGAYYEAIVETFADYVADKLG